MLLENSTLWDSNSYWASDSQLCMEVFLLYGPSPTESLGGYCIACLVGQYFKVSFTENDIRIPYPPSFVMITNILK